LAAVGGSVKGSAPSVPALAAGVAGSNVETVDLSLFKKIKDLGGGSFGILYSAEDPRTGGIVAIKLLRRNILNEEAAILFEREVEILGSVDHETLLGLRGYVPIDASNGDPPAILTDYMSGGSLQSLIDCERRRHRVEKWDRVQKLIVIYGVSIGMLILHRHRIIHRDLKPDNVLLNDKLEPKVADFGLSKFVDHGKTLSQTGDRGTPIYMAPEIHEGNAYSWSVDVYSYGILVYATIVGKAPYEGLTFPSVTALGIKVIGGLRPEIPSDVEAKWERVMRQCWERDPEARPSFEDVCRLLGSREFIGDLDSSEASRFIEYQRRVCPSDLIRE
jgi:serine/threonine protein kinase